MIFNEIRSKTLKDEIKTGMFINAIFNKVTILSDQQVISHLIQVNVTTTNLKTIKAKHQIINAP